MSPLEEFEAKITAEGEIYFTPKFWEDLNEIYSQSLEKAVQPLIEAAQQPIPLLWKDIRDYDLSEKRTDERINDFPAEGDIVFVISYTGKAELKFDSPNADPFDLETYKKLKHRYTELFLTNEAQDGATIKILFGRGDWDLIETYPEIDLEGPIRNDYLEQITDPLKIGQIIKDGHIVPHADIACEKILITGTTRLDQWRSTEDYTFIAPGKILLHAATKLSDWQHPSNTTYIHGGQIYTESILTAALAALSITTEKLAAGAATAEKMTITDLADIRNLLTVAEEKILIGENVLGINLHGIKIVDEQDPPVTRVAVGHLATGIKNYGISFWDEDGVQFSALGHLQQIWEKVHDEYLSEDKTNITISNLHGDTDQVYFIHCSFINQSTEAGGYNFHMQINGDTGNNYGRKYILVIEDDSVSGGSTTVNHWYMGAGDTVNKVCSTFLILEAKSGKYRTSYGFTSIGALGGSLQRASVLGQVWNNTDDEITSILIGAGKELGMKAGTHIQIYKIPAYA